MPYPNTYRYPRPASAITPQDMALLHKARKSAGRRTPISSLVAEAVRVTYGSSNPGTPLNERKEPA